jgi:hypothetical protein
MFFWGRLRPVDLDYVPVDEGMLTPNALPLELA